MSWLVIAAIYWEKKGRIAAGAACMGGAVLLKAFALTLLCYYVWRGRWKMAGASVAAIILGGLLLPSAVFGWHGNLHYISEWTHEVARPALGSESTRTHSELYDQLLSMERPRNQDLGSVMQRLIEGHQTRVMVLALAAALGLPIWLVGRKANAQSEPLILGAVVVWMLLVSPVAEDHYFSLYVLPAAYTLAASMGVERSMRRWGYAVLALVGLLNLGAVLDIGRRFEIYGAVFWGGLLSEKLLLAARQIFRRDVFDVCGDAPLLTKRVGNLAVAIAPKHILQRHICASAGTERTVENCVRIGNVHMQIHGITRTRVGGRRQLAHGVVHKDGGIADLQFGMHYFAVGPWEALDFGGAKDFFVEVDGPRGILDDEVWRKGVVPLGNRLHIRHFVSS